MKRALASIVALTVILGTAACSSDEKSAAQGPAKQEDKQAGPAWKLKLSSVCVAGQAEDCLAHYGFTVSADARFAVGPGPQGQLIAGQLSAEEFAAIEQHASKLVSGVQAQGDPEVCGPNTHTDHSDAVVLVRQDSSEVQVVRTGRTEFCFRSYALDESLALHNAIRELAKAHYPKRFPDTCLDASLKVETDIAGLRGCSHDSDCRYVDRNYNVVLEGHAQWISTDTCTVLGPVVVANRFKFEEARDLLLEGRANARAVCGDRMFRGNCAQKGFDSSIAPPVCVQNVCQVNPLIANQ